MLKIKGNNYSILEQSIHNLDLSIELFYKKEYSGVVLIAGAAEESFGKILNNDKKPNILQNGQNMVAKDGVNDKKYKFIMNRIKNWLKHAETDNKFAPAIHCDMEFEAIQYIYRAISNYLDLKNGIRETHKMFFQYLIKNREDFRDEFKNKNIKIDEFEIIN